MRDVRSRNYFEQMKGRGTRTLDAENLHKVSPAAHAVKDRFVIIDAVGVTKSLKTDSRPLERKPGVPLKALMLSLITGDQSEDTCTSLANRLTRLDKQMNEKEHEKFSQLSGGITVHDAVQHLLDSFNPDIIENAPPDVQTEMLEKAAAPFNKPELRDFIEDVRKSYEQIIDDVNIDTVLDSGWNADAASRAESIRKTFHRFIEENKNEITALSFFYNQRWKEQALTLKMIEEVSDAMKKAPYGLSLERLGRAYNSKSPLTQLADIVSLIRYDLGIDKELKPYSSIVNTNFKAWVFRQNAGSVHFSDEQMDWLRLVKDFIAQNISITPDDLELGNFAGRGGLGKFYSLFGSRYEAIQNDSN
jgi:type I restriction enzyme R subunit